MKVTGKFEAKVLNWFVGLQVHLGTIVCFQKICWHVIEHCAMQLNCKMESNSRF